MGQKPRHSGFQKLGMGVVVAAATDQSVVGSVAVVNRGAELSRLWRIDRDALAPHLAGLDDDPWLPLGGRKRFRAAVGGLLLLTRRSAALGDRQSHASRIAAEGGFRQLYGPTASSTDAELEAEIMGAFVLLAIRHAWKVVDEVTPESQRQPFLRSGFHVVIKEILAGTFHTFQCDCCGNVGFVIGRRPARFCSDRCNSTGPTARADAGKAKDFKVDLLERLQRIGL